MSIACASERVEDVELAGAATAVLVRRCEIGHLPAEKHRGLEGIADRRAAVDEELVDVRDRRVDQRVVLRRRRRHLGLPGEDHEPDPEVARSLVEERSQRLLSGAEPRRLDILRLHRARRVDDEDHGGALLHERAVNLRARDAHDQHRETERHER